VAQSILIQSYAPGPQPAWQRRCVDSVRDWARRAGWEYRYVDDRLLEVVPQWYRERCGRHKLPVTDLGRLLLMREALAEPGCVEALWVDADVLVFAPGLEPRSPQGFAFAKELWIWRDRQGRVDVEHKVNNSLVYMRQGTPVLDSFIALSERIVRETPAGQLTHDAASTAPLTRMAKEAALPLVPGAALLSPQLLVELAAGESDLARRYAGYLREPLVCANLCGSLVGRRIWDTTLDEATMEGAVAALLASSGGAINAFISR
jgi:hypothetical protein